MKLFRYITLLVAAGLFASCETEVDTLQISTPDDFVAPVLNQCSDVVVTADNAKTASANFTWKAANFGVSVEVLYSIYVSYGENKALLGQARNTKADISYENVNSVALSGLKIAPNATANVTVYVEAQMSGTDKYKPISSKTSTFNITTYSVPAKALYVVGNLNGWSPEKAVEIWETEGGTNVYEGIYDFVSDGATSNFQLLQTLGSWEGQLGYDKFSNHGESITKAGGDMALPIGFWKLSVNKAAMTIEASKVTSVGILGTINGWKDKVGDDLPLKYKVATNVWESAPVTFDANGEFLIRLNYDWSKKYGASGKNSTVIQGGLELTSGGGANIKVAVAGTYVIKFHADRTPCVVEIIKQ